MQNLVSIMNDIIFLLIVHIMQYFMLQKLYCLKKEFQLKHTGLIHQFGLEYVVKGKFDEKIAKKLSGLEEDRNKVDYEFDFDFAEKIKAKTDLKDAEIFIEECKKFINKPL